MIAGILLATVASFAASAVLYGLPSASRLLQQRGRPRAGITFSMQMVTVVLRSLISAALIAGLMTTAGWHGAGEGVLLGLALTVLPAMLLLGGVVHESTPLPLAALHLLDWLIKLVVIGALVGLFL